jgi:hypothetical protein
MAVFVPRNRKWSDLSGAQRLAIMIVGLVEVVMLVATLRDIRRRPADEINGSKRLWTAAAFVNFFGPLAYFIFGRKRG